MFGPRKRLRGAQPWHTGKQQPSALGLQRAKGNQMASKIGRALGRPEVSREQMMRNHFTEVSRGPSWWPSQDAREERANPTFVSGVSAVSALSELVGLGREKPADEPGERFVRPHAVHAETGETNAAAQRATAKAMFKVEPWW